jgi:hypothetical protein
VGGRVNRKREEGYPLSPKSGVSAGIGNRRRSRVGRRRSGEGGGGGGGEGRRAVGGTRPKEVGGELALGRARPDDEVEQLDGGLVIGLLRQHLHLLHFVAGRRVV